MKTYHRHLLGQWCYNFTLAFCVLNLLLLVGNLVRYGSKVGVVHILPMLPALLPSMLVYSIPMSALTATISTLSRARQLNEPVTLASSGIGLFQLMTPFVWLGLMLSSLTAVSFQWLQPWGEDYKNHYLSNIGANLLAAELDKPQATLQLGEDTLSFFDRGGGVRSAVIQHRENQRIRQEIFASDASVAIDSENKKVSITAKGKVHLVQYDGRRIGHGYISNYPTTELPYPERFDGSASFRQWPLSRMWREIQKGKHVELRKLEGDFYEKLSLIFSPFLLVLAAFPLGFAGKDSSRFTGFLMGLGLIFLVYYPLLIAGKKLAMGGTLLPWACLQLPNMALLVLAIWGCRRLDGKI